MYRKLVLIAFALVILILTAPLILADPVLENLKDGQKINGFTARALYLDGSEKPMVFLTNRS